ncbi:MAG TPA: SRPBCC family protein [Pyrinomonadaceae bacterium]|nr:SRPBCC family protein [Pyrinomonadaceae bacterium]
MTEPFFTFDDELDLRFERIVDIKPELVWAAWTQPEHLVHWFTPAPWKTIACEIDLRPGGIFRTVMQSPEGQEFPGTGCYLDVVENERFVWTSALGPGFRPNAPEPDAMFFTAMISIEPDGDGTKYTAVAIHRSKEDRKKHEDMGFEHGWGKALEQLVEYMKSV